MYVLEPSRPPPHAHLSFPHSHIRLNKRPRENPKRKTQQQKKEDKSKGNQQQRRQCQPQMTNLSLNFGQKGRHGKDGQEWEVVGGGGGLGGKTVTTLLANCLA